MHIALSLVGITFLTVQCRSRAVRQNDRQYPVETIIYQPIDQRSFKQERTLQPVSRATEQYEYQYEPVYTYPEEPGYEPDYVRKGTKQIISRPKLQGKPLAAVEQYLKEVTPTTKTVYDPKTYKVPVERKRIQYTYRAETQRQPLYQHYSGELPKGSPVAQNILAYHNALLAHQNALYEQQRIEQLKRQQEQERQQTQQQEQGNLPHSEIYVTQNIQKTTPAPPVQKVKTKTSTLDDEIAYYRKLQYQQQQTKQQSQEYESKDPAPVKYQARIPQNSKPELLDTDEENAFMYQPQNQYTTKEAVKSTNTPKEQIYLSDVKYQQKVVYQPVSQNEDDKYYGQTQAIQYQLQPVVGAYQPEQAPVRYQEQPTKSVQQSAVPNSHKYGGNIVKYHSVQANKATRTRQQVEPQYILQEQTPQIQNYEAQQYAEPQQAQRQPQHYQQQQPAYLGPTDEEYKQSQFKQHLGRNSSLRVLKTGKPVVFIGHEE